MGEPLKYQFNLPSEGRPHDVNISVFRYPGIKEFWPQKTTRRIYDAILGVRAVVIHATTGDSSEGAVSVMRDPDAQASWHGSSRPNMSLNMGNSSGPAPRRPGGLRDGSQGQG